MGPLKGLKIIELAGIGPAPFCGMMLADMGAEVVCIERAVRSPLKPASDCTRRGKRSIELDLKSADGRDTFLRLIAKADAVFEGYRPGVMEKLGLGPEQCMAVNPRLVYGRMTGWGQAGPLANAAGHDINYISLTGSLHAIGHSGGKPVVPLSLVGDYGGGAMFLAFGMVCALLEARHSGLGQVVDAAMTDGSALLMAVFHSLDEQGQWTPARGSNLLDGGAPFYDVYATSDDKYVSIGSIEPQFFALLLEKLGLNEAEFGAQFDMQRWPDQKRMLESVFRTRSRLEWCSLMEGTDVCFAPVLDLREAPLHPHNRARETYVELGGMTQPAAAPRFSRTPTGITFAPHDPGSDRDAVLRDWLGQLEPDREKRSLK
jgi:alpha-methylacyl-CoA racemase